MYEAAKGIQQDPTKRGKRGENISTSTVIDPSKFKVFFPSKQTVQKSKGGAGYHTQLSAVFPTHC